MRKRMFALLMAAAMAVAATGCGSGDSGNSGDSGSSDGGSSSGKTITVAFWDNNQLAGLKQIAEEWSQTSGYDVEFTAPDWGSYWTILEAGVSGGEMPDVFWMHSNNADKYGVEYPTEDWTWEDFAAKAQEIADKGAADGVYGTYCNVSNDQDGWYNIVYGRLSRRLATCSMSMHLSSQTEDMAQRSLCS